MTLVLMNPGTGPVPWAAAGDVTLRRAWRNARLFRRDVDLIGVKLERVPSRDDPGGRYGFRLRLGRRRVVVDVPGCAREKLDWGPPGSGLAGIPPRLYVNDSSFTWVNAVDLARDDLEGVGEEP